jgi:hypothetical protein
MSNFVKLISRKLVKKDPKKIADASIRTGMDIILFALRNIDTNDCKQQ